MAHPKSNLDTESRQWHVTGLKKVLGFRQLVFFYVVAIFGIRLLPAATSAGPSIIIYILLSMVIFFIPMGLTVTDLGKRYPVEGGIYIWAKKAFGDFHGYITAWSYWTANLAFFPSLLLFSSSQILHIVPGFAPYAENSMILALISITSILIILVLNIIGLKISTIFNNISALASYAGVALVVLIGVINWIQIGPATDLSPANWIPSLSSIKDLVFLSTVVYLFAGLESASMLSGEVHNPTRTIPRAILASGILISILYLVSSFSLLLSVTPEQLSDLTGMTDAVSAGASRIAAGQFTDAATALISILLVLMSLGGASVWLAATARLPFVVGLDRYLPSVFGKLHPRYGTPYISLIALVIITIFFVLLAGMGEKAEQVYNILISLEIVTFLIPYLYMFGSVIKFELDKKYRGKVELPGGRKNAMLAGITGFLVVLVSIILALVPGDDVANPARFYLTVLGSVALNLCAAIGIYLYAKRKLKKQALNEGQETEND